MKTRLAIVGAFLAAVVAIVLFSQRRPSVNPPASAGASRPSSSAATVSPPDPPAPATTISFLYGTEKKEWVEEAVASFGKEHPEIRVQLVAKGSLEAEQAIVDDKERPTLFSPADSMVLNLLVADWSAKTKGTLIASSGEDTPETLVVTPLVFVAWEDRAKVLEKAAGGTLTWKSIHKAVASNQGWPAVGGKAEWGFVKLGHTDPTRSNSGIQALVLMSLEYFGKGDLAVGDVLKPDYQTFVRETEKGVTRFEASTGTFMTDMVRFGPSKYDISVVYENLAIAQIANAEGRWGELRVYYPGTTLWSDHPVALLQADWVSPAQKTAARAFIAHLRSKPVQERALSYGFRPGDPAVPMKTGDGPFTRLASHGIRVDLPPVAKTPDGEVVRALLTMWTRVVGAR